MLAELCSGTNDYGSLFLVIEMRPTSSLRKVGGSESESLKFSSEHVEDVSGLVGVVERTAMPRPLERDVDLQQNRDL